MVNNVRNSRGVSAGFTLMELLVAMTLLGILMTALFGSLRLGARVWEASDRVLRNEGQTMSIRAFLQDRLEQAMPVVLLLDDGRTKIVFAGERSALRIASTMPESVGFGPYIIELLLTPSGQGADVADLSIRWRPVDDQAVSVDERVLVEDLSTMSLGYFGTKGDEGDGPVWHATWQEQERLPDLIRLELRFDEEGERRWPSLIVSPKVDEWYDTDY